MIQKLNRARGREWVVAAVVAMFVFVAFFAAGCQDRVFDFGGTVVNPDAGSTGSGGSGLGSGGAIATGSGGSGGRATDGGGSGGAGGNGGGSGGAGGGIVECKDGDPARQTDVANCGKCFNLCREANATPACVAGVCQYTCETGFFDADKNPANGCECIKSNAGVEVCDGLDNDCNGIVDEGFNFMTDAANCGGCNKPCSFPFATATCDQGVCKMIACLTDFYDRDPAIPGCETSCRKTNGGVEICDGLDNDCNGLVDDNPAAAAITCKSKGVCAGVTPTCMGQAGYVCKYPSTFQDVEDVSKGCDGLDNDCDGFTDEAFDIGKSCIVGSGPCAGTGTWVCDNAQAAHRRCDGQMKTPGVEVCNGKDDDCDGKIDELDSLSDKTADDALVYFAAKDVTIFAYEASRYDASATDYGFDSGRRPCSVGGKQPWSNITKEKAEAACEKIGTGWRLCTKDEWFDACNGSGNTTFPYGATFDGSKCNGYDYPKAAGVTTEPTGSAAMCTSAITASDKLFDMSGNVKEWVLSTAATSGPFELRGGAYDIASFLDNTVTPAATRAPGLQCDASTPAPAVDVVLPSVGFRCCRTGALPP
ncbi:MAG TPA: MopE-related protein [Polyangia bacterium]|nr:MopE-related protein [Polyangia bacterium]